LKVGAMADNDGAIGPSDLAKPDERAELSYELSPDLVTLTTARPAEAEAIRTMRTHVMARHLEDGRRGLAMCAASKAAGCTFMATNLAVSLAQIGIKTLLIDGDLRAPGVEHVIRPLAPTAGLMQCLTSPELHPHDQIHSEVLPNLSVLYAGGVTDNAQELLGSAAFSALIDRCLRDFEFTLIDTPPTNRCADARRIISVVGYGVIVARRNVSFLNEVAVLASQLQEDGAKVIGTVLNEV
jgi:capsular exopolysaccharide synthesis family protein